MTNAASIGKTIFLSLLLVGTAAGFAGCAKPGLVVCTKTPATDQEVEIRLVENQLKIEPDYVTVTVSRCDQVVWVWASEPPKEFTVSLAHDRKEDQSAKDHPAGFNPFLRPFPRPPAEKVWRSDVAGEIQSGPAKNAASGHVYKFTIKAINRPGVKPLDPHVHFRK